MCKDTASLVGTRPAFALTHQAMIQAMIHTVRQPRPIQRFYRKRLRRKGRKVARVAAAQKLLTHLYRVLVSEEPTTGWSVDSTRRDELGTLHGVRDRRGT